MSNQHTKISKTKLQFAFWGVGLALGIFKLILPPLFQYQYMEIPDVATGLTLQQKMGFAHRFIDNITYTSISFWILLGLLFGTGIGLYLSGLFETER